jgi:hypothetical protein
MRCQACGQENKPDHTFCAQCLEMLSKQKTTTVVEGGRSVNMPPQDEHLVDIQYSSPPATVRPVWFWGLLTLACLFIIFFLLYG